MNYDFKEIEAKWQKKWSKDPYFKTKSDRKGKKFYCLDMFPYPSGSGIHMGHWKNYVLSDIYARIKFLQGYNVLHPMGWDAFGLPAENAAIKLGLHPKENTANNIANFKRQLSQIGAMYDWDKEVNTTDPNYYKWTQWIFLQMHKAGLAYQSEAPINWCPSCLTGLANEEVVGGKCDRCGTEVTKKLIRQWVLKITEYAEKLLEGLDKLEWPEKVKSMQRNWIGKSVGATVNFKVAGDESSNLEVFTTRPDTLFGATFVALAYDHPLVSKLTSKENQKSVENFIKEMQEQSSEDRFAENPEKKGVFLGSYVINPVNDQKIPVYLASYILSNYGTGAIMAVPAHDERDFEFAKKYNLPIIEVVKSQATDESIYDENGNLTCATTGDGILINSAQFNGLDAKSEGSAKIIKFLEDKGVGSAKTCYKLRDWIFSRQRYWGEPIPMVHCSKCGTVPVDEKDLPVVLPEVENYQPTGTGESPLAAISEWVNTKCPKCGDSAKRETNTMPQWAGSCWYFLRYPNTELNDKPFDSQDMKYWLPVDLYIGGIEHAVLHLLYARFYIKVLHDLGYLEFDEPFTHLFNQGMICAKSNSGRIEKMSKSKGNAVNPDDMVGEFGTDALRLYMLFMGPPEMDVEWQDSGLKGTKNFLGRLWKLLTTTEFVETADEKTLKRFHLFLKDFAERIESFKVNTAVSAMMEFLNDLSEQKLKLDRKTTQQFLAAISVMVPHFSSELLEKLLNKNLADCSWPTFDPKLAAVNEIEIAVQVNGKLRANVTIQKGESQQDVQSKAEIAIEKWLKEGTVIKVIFVADRLINFVIK
ncbi:TPA: leucine--tRNA ligase [Candidatus Dependentiae bacterium]|nr:MAG: Leucine-tRNA ligase [candidate division TM6 bacterium GW2011_GWE2_31_21]KKP53461.1 MAG: Leucine-tRNA ligase [candidate division TM6 bacterium GW2011_GWF2_33_332]HBS48297.1 leucine--tRNA ligase [Candidatus Dependentiae bacterium]HBZ73724.1 leucine--tRNA ligase [Candidatus Dependentiae bacterium]